MKVLLLEDVDNLGLAGEVKRVANGFARNYLIPQKMAILATSGALKQADTIRKTGERRRASEKDDAEAMANIIRGQTFTFERRAGEMGKLYGSVTSNEIAEALSEKVGTPIDKRKVALSEPLRLLGEYEVAVKLMVGVMAQVKVVVVQQGALGGQVWSEAAVPAPEAEAAPSPEETEAAQFEAAFPETLEEAGES